MKVILLKALTLRIKVFIQDEDSNRPVSSKYELELIVHCSLDNCQERMASVPTSMGKTE